MDSNAAFLIFVFQAPALTEHSAGLFHPIIFLPGRGKGHLNYQLMKNSCRMPAIAGKWMKSDAEEIWVI
jgi:hypothetical protein